MRVASASYTKRAAKRKHRQRRGCLLTDLTTSKAKTITIYDPEKGLKTIAVARAGEKHWARAKDATKLFAAIETKLWAQADYVVWRDGGPGRGKHGGDHKSDQVSVLKLDLPKADPGDLTAHRWRKSFCSTNGEGTAVDEEKLAIALNDARMRCTRVCEQLPKGTERGTAGTGEFERYTPEVYIEAARKVLGQIDLDPATSSKAQKTVQAAHFFTAKDDGLAQEWFGRVWLNPPYHRDLAPQFIAKLSDELKVGRVKSAIMLTNNSTDTDWFVVALKECAGICFTHGRINFHVPNGPDVLPTQGQAFFYFGDDVKRFEDVFCAIGPCMRPSREFVEVSNDDKKKRRLGVGRGRAKSG